MQTSTKTAHYPYIAWLPDLEIRSPLKFNQSFLVSLHNLFSNGRISDSTFSMVIQFATKI